MVCALLGTLVQAQTPLQGIDRQQIETAIKAQQLDANRIWHALLHLDKGQPRIQTSSFILSQGAFTPYQEILATLDFLYGENPTAVCRFPARYVWLKDRLQLPALPISECGEINEFIDKSPFDELTLVFASESVTQPASMMGHTFLKVSGKDAAGQRIEHAISYYTDANSINLPKLLWESLISGKKGFFSLTPYERESKKYIEDEHRNLWEYKIRTNAAQRELIRNHLFELKQTELIYFLHSYNCATVLQNILGLTGEFQIPKSGWTTPKDVIQQAYQSGLVVTTGTYVSDQWTYAFLRPGQLTGHGRAQEEALEFTNRFAPIHIGSSQQHHFLQALNNVLLETQKITEDHWKDNHAHLTQQTTALFQAPLKLHGQLNPAVAQGDSSIGLSFLSRPKGLSTLLNFMPASHQLMDDHRHQLAETAVQLFSGSVEITPQSTVRLNQFNILSIKSLRPWNPVLKPISSQTNIGYGSLTGHPDDPKTLHGQAAAGITQRLNTHLDVTFLLGGGVQTKPSASSIFISSEISAIYRASSNTKTLLTWERWHSPHDQTQRIKAQQVFYLDSAVLLWSDVDVTVKSGIQRQTLGFGIQKNF